MAKPSEQIDERDASSPKVGVLLQASRQRLGEDLSDVAQMLRIRLPYLVAIEAGQYRDLPGATYAVGFIRAYAEHLGLDSDEVVRRFKAESIDGGEGDRRLSFPTPVPETGIPGGAYVFIGLVIAVLGYGAWYISTTDDGFFAELISPLDEQMTTLLSDEKTIESEKSEPEPTVDTSQADEISSSDTPEPAVEVVSEPTVGAAPVSEEIPVVEAVSASETPESNEAAPVIAAQPQETAVTPSREPEPEPEAPKIVVSASEPVVAAVKKTIKPVIPEPNPEPTVEPVVEAVVEPKIEKTEAKKPEVIVAKPIEVAKAIPEVEAPSKPVVELTPEPKPEPVKVISDATLSAASGTESEIASPEPVAEPEVAAVSALSKTEASGSSRITINAKSNSWIQVRDDNANTMLVTRLLTAGDSYVVPDLPGLVLLTGNAGALEIVVDGDAVPSIGEMGVVRRSVVLEADRLKAGTAVSN